MPEAQYKRDLNHHYLIFPWEEEQPDYRVHMLCHHQIGEMLPCTVRRVNQEMLFAYEISGKQSLRQIFDKRPMNGEDIQSLMKHISNVMEHMKEYLLDMDMLILEPDYIFCPESGGGYYFCCLPDMKNNTFAGLQKLSEYLLEILDQRDPEAVRLGYILYRSARQENFSLIKLLEEESGRAAPEAKDFIKKEPGKEPVSGQIHAEPGDAAVYMEQTEWQAAATENMLPDGTAEKPLQDARPSDLTDRYEYGMQQPKPAKKQKSGRLRKKQAAIKRTGLFDREERKKEEKKENRTFFAGPLQSYAGEKTFSYGSAGCMLQNCKNPKVVFAPAEFPFLLGSLECAVDGFVDGPGVSHFHARIEKENDSYYLTDLNSAGGTFVNGMQIPPEVKKQISFGDTVGLGAETFRFLNKRNGN